MHPDEKLIKAQAQKAAGGQCNVAAPMDQAAGWPLGEANGYSHRPYTLQEEAEESEKHHYQEAAKAGQVALFLAQHPEFDEFIRLVRARAIQF